MELSSELVAEILATLRQPAAVPVGAEHRRAPRIEQRASVLVTRWPEAPANAGGTPASQAFTATVRNCSPTGIAVMHTRTMERGEQFAVRLMDQGRQTVAILCRVAHCRRVNPLFFLIGAEFTRVLGAGEGSEAAYTKLSA